LRQLQYFKDHRKPTWLELFFDLVLVAIVQVITHNLSHTHHGDLTLDQMIQFPVEFLPIWWVWATHTLYANWFDTDSKSYRLATLAIMFLLFSMSSFLGDNLFERYYLFIIFYFSIRMILAAFFFSSINKIEDSKEHTRAIAYITILGAIISASSVFFASTNIRELILISGILFEMIAIIFVRNKFFMLPIHKEHFVERVGLLSIILLGESILVMTQSINTVDWNATSVFAAITGFIMIGAIWWIYFDSFEVLPRLKSLTNGFVLLYSHFFLASGLVILASLIRLTVLSDINMHDFQILAIVGMCSFYFGKQLIYYISLPVFRVNIIINSLACITITVLSTFLPKPEYALFGMTVGMLFYTYANKKWATGKDVSDLLE